MIDLRTRLLDTLTTQFKDESQSAVARLKDGVAPYVRYVNAERERLERNEALLEKLRHRISSLRARSEAVLQK